MRVIPFTKQGFENLKKQLEIETLKRPDAVKVLARAREMGDLSENGLYKAAKQELLNIDRQIRHLKNLVRGGKILIPLDNGTVQIGHKVLVKTENEQKEYFIVGEYEADPNKNKISNKSPIGHNLMGKKVGDEIKINIPSGIINYTIISISQS